MPLPTPVMMRPVMNCASGVAFLSAVTWMITPRIMILPPIMMARRRPRKSPKARMKIAPKRQPIS